MTAAAVVILNWNGADDTLECLARLRDATISLHLIVVDNGSSDDSVERIEASRLADEVLATGSNLGYAGGNNVGIRHALQSDFEVVGVLNNDTLAEPAMPATVISALSAERAASPDIRYFDTPAESWFLGGVFEGGYARHLLPEEQRPGPTELLSGCCIFARREVWERVGCFDESMFLTFEDFDWSLRARAVGVELVCIADAILLHKVSRSFRSSTVSARLGAFYFARNGLRLAWRWDRRSLLRFSSRHVLRPAARSLKRGGSDTAFLLLGAAAFAFGQSGRAPRALERLAAL